MTPSRIFKKSNAAYEIAKVACMLFWLPLISLIIAAIYLNW
jgi:hypothetical protein